MTRKNSTILIIITIAVFVAITALATFAYFSTSSRIDANIGVNVETSGVSYIFTASGSDEINMPITAIEMSEANVSTEHIKSGSGDIKVTLASPSNDVLTTCTYDIIWVWDSEQKYETPDVPLPHTQDGKTYPYEFSTKVSGQEEKDLSTLEAGKTANSIILQKGASISSASTTPTEKTHTIEAKIYNLPVVQTNLFDKKFRAHMTIENVHCSMADHKNIIATGSDYSGTYDTSSHSISVAVTEPTSDYKVYYSTSTPLTKDNYSTSGTQTNPTRTVSGSTDVYWCAVAEGYNPYCNNNQIIINKATLAVTGNDKTVTADGNGHNITVSTSNPPAGYKVYYSTTPLNTSNYETGSQTEPSITSGGQTTIYWCAVAENYNPTCSSNKVIINKVASPLTLAKTSITSYDNKTSTTFTYSGDGDISCASTESTTCKIDAANKTVTLERETCGVVNEKITINVSEGTISSSTTAILNISWQCLDPETLVYIWDKKKKKKRKKKLKDITKDDIVYSYDYASDQIITRKVKKIHVNKAKEIYHIVFEDDELKITGDHPVCVDGAGYLNVSQLKVGYKLLAQDGTSHEIKDIYVEVLDKEKDMYCIELEDGTSLSVGTKGIICLSMFVSTSVAMMRSVSAIVGNCSDDGYYGNIF